ASAPPPARHRQRATLNVPRPHTARPTTRAALPARDDAFPCPPRATRGRWRAHARLRCSARTNLGGGPPRERGARPPVVGGGPGAGGRRARRRGLASLRLQRDGWLRIA